MDRILKNEWRHGVLGQADSYIETNNSLPESKLHRIKSKRVIVSNRVGMIKFGGVNN